MAAPHAFREAEQEVPLARDLAQFRTALREEIDAARKAAASSAVPLVNGRRIGQAAFGHQYLFTVDSALNLPDGAPGDLLIPDHPPLEATVISIEGMAITLSLSQDAGDFIPRARLQSSLVHLLRKLIERIEGMADRDNPAGARLLGQTSPRGVPIDERVTSLNEFQAEAVASALGRDTTLVWGPPGTGKTRTIGTIGEELWKANRSVLLVSHTNAAVDQALLHIGDALGERAEDGSVLRVGAPKDLRLLERPRLLAETHIKERAEVLDREEADLRAERGQAVARVREAHELIALAAWLPEAEADITRLEDEAARSRELAEALKQRQLDLARVEEEEPAWRDRAGAAQAMSAEIAREATLAGAVAKAQSRATTARADVDAASDRVRDAGELLEQTEAANAMTRRLRRLPRPEQQAAVVHAQQDKLTSLRAIGDRAEHELQSLTQELGEVRDGLAGFAAQHGDSPDCVLAETGRLLRDLNERRQAAREAQRTLDDLRATVDAEIAERWALLNSRSPLGEAPALAEDRLEALREGRNRAAAELGELNAADLQAEISQLNERVRAIDQRLEAIAEEKAAIEEAVIADARIVATTLTRAYLRDSIQNRRFDTVILDEASMAPIPALWVAAATAERNVVLVGDFRQLPPIKHSEHPLAKRWLGQDIFEESGVRRAHDTGRPPEHLVVLRTQYRMHPQISAVPNELIYDGLLADDHATLDDSELDGWFNRDWGPDAPVVLVDTESLNAWVTGVGGTGRTSRLNFLSATVCADLAERMLRADRPELAEGSSRRILIGAPYRPHARLVELLLQDLGLQREVVAGTAHTFQGSEAPVVIFDLVNDEPHWRVGMFAPAYDETTRRLLNVALTRPRHRLVIVGDFAYIRSKSRHAFLGRLVDFLEARYPKADARELVGAGLAARAAKAQLRAVGGPIEPDQQRLVVTQGDFYGLLSRDLAAAAERVVIYSPFITANRLGQLEPQLKAAVERGTRIYVVTKTIEERGERDQASYGDLEAALRGWGIEVLHKRQMHEKLVFVDEGILWSGSLNPLSFSATQEVMERRSSERVVADYAQALRVVDLLALAESADRACAICGTELAMAEGTAEPYWRCPSEDCDYTRNIGQPAPRDGLVVCASPGCGKRVKFGFWGDDARWRCTVNPRHRQRIAKSHLKLPKMRALVPAQELRKLDKRFGLDGQDRPRLEPTQRPLAGKAGEAAMPPREPVAPSRSGTQDPEIAKLQAQVDALSRRLAASDEDAAEAMSPDLDRLRAEIQQLNQTRPPSRESARDRSSNGQATPRELDLLRLLAAHWSRREIAEKLGLSSHTVKTYIRDLYRKLGVHERADAVRVAKRKGWL